MIMAAITRTFRPSRSKVALAILIGLVLLVVINALAIFCSPLEIMSLTSQWSLNYPCGFVSKAVEFFGSRFALLSYRQLVVIPMLGYMASCILNEALSSRVAAK
jgi:hypothetical protein